MSIDRKTIENLYGGLAPKVRRRLDEAVERIVRSKEAGGKVVAVVGSGPNIHEGVTTLIAELITKGILDGVSTSSAVINHEMAGTLEKVKRFDGVAFGMDPAKLPSDGQFEVGVLAPELLAAYAAEAEVDLSLYRKMRRAKGNTIVKVAGNMAYPTGLRTERLARTVLRLARERGIPFEEMAGYGADPHTMLGAACRRGVPILVTVPQLIGGGEVGLAVGDAIPISERCRRIAALMAGADVIIESALALSQEIHDGPFETYTGHGVWTDWQGGETYSLAEKTLVRIDLDPALEKAWTKERKGRMVSTAVDRGLPKTTFLKIPFRMEMSGFARIPGSLPLVGDIGVIWPVLALHTAEALGVELEFMSYKQSLPQGRKMREWIVQNVRPLDREALLAAAERIPKVQGGGEQARAPL